MRSGREGRERNGGLRSANSSTTRRLGADRGEPFHRSSSSTMLAKNLAGWGQALVTETIPSVAIRFQRRRIISISESSILSCAETRGKEKGREREELKRNPSRSTERRMISAAAVDYRQGNYFRWNGEAKERKRIEQPPIPAHLVIQVKSKAGYGRGSRSINVFSFPFKRCPVELLLLSARFSPAASSLQFLSSPPPPLPFLFPVRSSIEL